MILYQISLLGIRYNRTSIRNIGIAKYSNSYVTIFQNTKVIMESRSQFNHSKYCWKSHRRIFNEPIYNAVQDFCYPSRVLSYWFRAIFFTDKIKDKSPENRAQTRGFDAHMSRMFGFSGISLSTIWAWANLFSVHESSKHFPFYHIWWKSAHVNLWIVHTIALGYWFNDSLTFLVLATRMGILMQLSDKNIPNISFNYLKHLFIAY